MSAPEDTDNIGAKPCPTPESDRSITTPTVLPSGSPPRPTPTPAGPREPDPFYPESDGIQYRWIVAIKENLDYLYRNDPNVFVAVDHLIYPVQDDPSIRQPPDIYVAFGRPKGDRPSYKVGEEDNIFPQVIFEIWSPSNREGDMARKRAVYRRYGAEEYYVYDPETQTLEIWLQNTSSDFREVMEPRSFISPRLGIRFELTPGEELRLSHPDGQPFLSVAELWHLREQLALACEAEKQRAEAEKQGAEAAEREVQRLREWLRQKGLSPEGM
jgi:Uma2 family endonuclease